MADLEQRDSKVCKFVSAPPDQTGQPEQPRDCKLVSVSPDWTSVWRDIKNLPDSNKCCKLSCCKSCTYCTRAATKERHKSGCCKTTSVIKICVQCLHQLMNKNAVELVRNKKSLGFFNRLFLVPKPNNMWRPILDLSNLNKFFRAEKFKMETPEITRTSLQTGEWVTSIDFKDAYLHIPIASQSRKYLRFHVDGQTYQFKALPFGLSTGPMEFTIVAKEVKLMALQKDIRIHQYLDDWLVRTRSHQTCLHHTQTLVTCQVDS